MKSVSLFLDRKYCVSIQIKSIHSFYQSFFFYVFVFDRLKMKIFWSHEYEQVFI